MCLIIFLPETQKPTSTIILPGPGFLYVSFMKYTFMFMYIALASRLGSTFTFVYYNNPDHSICFHAKITPQMSHVMRQTVRFFFPDFLVAVKEAKNICFSK